jgi:hypothetical protein
MKTWTLWGREPAQWLAVIAATIALVSSQWWHLTNDQQGTLNAAIAAGFGIATALSVAKEKAAALVAGFAQSLIALALAFGADLSPDLQSTIMTFVITGVAWYLRTQLTAPVDADGGVVAAARTSPGHYS